MAWFSSRIQKKQVIAVFAVGKGRVSKRMPSRVETGMTALTVL